MLGTLVKSSALCLNPEFVENDPEAILPKVDNITSSFRWVAISYLLDNDNIYSVDFLGPISNDALDGKRDEYRYEQFLDSVAEDGILDPVFFKGNTYGNGHHRLAACIDLGYTHIPTTDNPDIEWKESGPVSW